MSKATTEEYGPENPRDWDPNSPLLTSLEAPHETGAVLRMHRAGRKATEIMTALRMRAVDMMQDMRHAMDAESDAAEAGVPIYDSRVKPGTV